MADIDIHPFGGHYRAESRPDENIPLDPVTKGGRSTWEPTREQEMSFGDPEGALLNGGDS